MITCSLCATENDDFAVTCQRCKAFLQDRLPNLNLFETAWGILQSPRESFRKITLAEHKNYSLFLYAMFGVSLSFTTFWYFQIGNRFDTLLDLMFWAMVTGVASGGAAALLLPASYHIVVKALGGKKSFRISFGLLAYSVMPIVVSLFLVLPIKLLTFGMFLFTSNPHPYTFKPLSYLVLMGFDGLVSLWSLGLAIVGAAVGHGISYFKAGVAVLFALGILTGALFLVGETFRG